MLFNIIHHFHLHLATDEIDGDTLLTITTCAANAMQVVLAIRGHLIVNNQADGLDVNAAGYDVRCHEDAAKTTAEISHTLLALCSVHIAVNAEDVKAIQAFLAEKAKKDAQ